ncbi:hypothetical protein HK104_000005 [Borealophlyctis nickersoniae]|nr:hypothetical protein HK104_000005 [Borealophlyctis nickersoniae]
MPWNMWTLDTLEVVNIIAFLNFVFWPVVATLTQPTSVLEYIQKGNRLCPMCKATIVFMAPPPQHPAPEGQQDVLREQLDALRTQRNTLQTQHDTLRTQHNDLQTSLLILQHKNASLQSDFQNLKNKHAATLRQCVSLEGAVGQAHEDREAESKTATAKMNALMAKLREEKRRTSDLMAQMTEEREARQELEAKLRVLAADAQTKCNKIVSAMKLQMEEAQSERSRAERDLAGVRKEAQEAKEQIRTCQVLAVQALSKGATTEQGRLNIQSMAMNVQIGSLIRELEKVKDECANHERQSRLNEEEVDTIRHRLDCVVREKKEYESRLNDIQARLLIVRGERDKLRDELGRRSKADGMDVLNDHTPSSASERKRKRPMDANGKGLSKRKVVPPTAPVSKRHRTVQQEQQAFLRLFVSGEIVQAP